MSWDRIPRARNLAPAPFRAWEALTAQAAAVSDPAMQAMIEERIAVLFGSGPSAMSRSQGSASEASCAEAVEQFIIDVSAMTDQQRDSVFADLGAGTYPFFQTVYVADMNFRLKAARAQLFDETSDEPVIPGLDASPGTSATPDSADLWPALDRFLTSVAVLDALDPVTTELIRLRGARAHDCRICQSRRNVTAMSDGADETTLDKIDYYETSDLAERHKVALRLTDAVIWQPAAYPTGLVEQVRATFSPEETVELVLDLIRNAANKVAVALQADQPVVTSGVEYFSVSAQGTLAYGLARPDRATASR